ncbi:MAG: hypothetical protein A2015_15755 [Spirochaetes bacterium GWF1_31_7]|nr:MAG: hypothetical protein A2Y30_10890 [Spirochaetes bacterium GWE1_32_154]OHD48257.1 MAG: hypothetical protein A2Y29_00525 [Spirochaetes bacterium GWE2_31_10]OHD50660.1 MAG: hypothetical protein A2015_15755 [Spirochaetes bacterium GWF1_31_7]OHD83192.1 MAG: hypothetical protein A2355_00630 [Spirochaetes bacterium RIFOXYB1_FULL_32_8]HBD96491.1 hypothetical protein [Spirochaetia bacterium]
MNIVDRLLNSGVKEENDINEIRLIRQVNGLNIFFTLVAFSVLVISIILYVKYKSMGVLLMAIVQSIATVFYFNNVIMTAKGHINITRVITIHIFEWQLFLDGVLIDVWGNPALPIIILFPLLAALVEVSIFRHLLVGLIQVGILILLHTVFSDVEIYIKALTNMNSSVLFMLEIVSISYIPMMAAVIISIIFKENIRAREKQKQLLNQITITNKQLEVYTERLRDESQRLLAEVNIAKKIQTMVLPGETEILEIKDLEFACIMRPADEVGGDYYDILQVDDTVTIGIGDVTGHGLSSGLVMMMAQTTIRTLAQLKLTDLPFFLSSVNSVLYENIKRIKENRNMTLSLLTYNNGSFSIVGQHESYIIVRANGDVECIDTQDMGFYVGILPDISIDISQKEFQLKKGDLLVLYTDGITESINEHNEQFGIERIISTIKKYHTLPIEKMKDKFMRDLYNFMGNSIPFDDITLVLIRQK